MDLWCALGTARGTVRVCGVHVWVTCESVCVTRSTGPPCAARGWHIHRSSTSVQLCGRRYMRGNR